MEEEEELEEGQDGGLDENGLSAYERQRQSNIERNKAALEALGLLDGGNLRRKKESRAWKKKVYERKERGEGRSTKPPDRLDPNDESKNPWKKKVVPPPPPPEPVEPPPRPPPGTVAGAPPTVAAPLPAPPRPRIAASAHAQSPSRRAGAAAP